jgi:RHS repeat-associated protein
MAVNATTLATTRRKTDPFGNPRGADPTWPNTRGFVAGNRDATGMTHLGAREYDPLTGRFISLDPILDFEDPQQAHGYAYANNRPTCLSDPSGLIATTNIDDEWYGVPRDRCANFSCVLAPPSPPPCNAFTCPAPPRDPRCGFGHGWCPIATPPSVGTARRGPDARCPSAVCSTGGLHTAADGSVAASRYLGEQGSKAGRTLSPAVPATAEEKTAAAKYLSWLRQNKIAQAIGRFGRSTAGRWTGRVLLGVGLILNFWGYFTEGDDGATALAKSAVETAFAAFGAARGATVGAVFGPWGGAIGFAVGGIAGGEGGSQVNQRVLEPAGVFRFTDSLFDWD